MKLTLLLILLFSTGLFAAAPVSVKFCREEINVFPWFDDEGTGLVQYQIEEIRKGTKYKISVEPIPWKRCQLLTQNGLYDGMLATSYTTDRFKKYEFPTLPDGTVDISRSLHEDSFGVYATKASKIEWKNQQFKNLKDNLVGVQLGYSAHEELAKRNIAVYTSFTSAPELINSMANGFIKVAVLQDFVTEHEFRKKPKLRQLIRHSDEPFKKVHQHIVFNKLYYKQNKEIVQNIWEKIKLTKKDPVYLKRKKDLLTN